LSEVHNTSILNTGRFPRYLRSLLWGQRSGRATAANIAKRFSALAHNSHLKHAR
jgi:hypothetical protein